MKKTVKKALFCATGLILPFSIQSPSTAHADFPGISLTSSARSTDVTTADLNQDGRDDVIKALKTKSVGVQLAKKDGGFENEIAYPTNLSQTTEFVATGKLSNDNIPDVVAADRTGNISIFTNNGSGQLGTGSKVAISTAPFNISDINMGDVTGDGNADVIVATVDTSVMFMPIGKMIVVPVNASGSLLLGSKKEYSLGASSPTSIQAGKLNGDQYNDIAVNNNLNGTIDVFPQKSDGSGTLDPKQQFSSTLFSVNSLAIADINNDGKNDLLAGSNAVSKFAILDGTHSSDKSNLFAAARTYALRFVSSRTDNIISADFNDDGFQDVAIGSSANLVVNIFLNQRNGSFDSDNPQVFAPGFTQSAISSGDVDQDNRPDLVAASDVAPIIQVGMNDYAPAASFSTGEAAFPETAVGASTSQSVTVTNTGVAQLRPTTVQLGGEGVSAFRVTGETCSGAKLNLGESCKINLAFSPQQPGAFVASLTLQAEKSTSNSIQITGKGQPQQPGPVKTDPKTKDPNGSATTEFPELKTVSLAKKKIQLKVVCPSTQDCTGKVQITYGRRVLGVTTYTIKPQAAKTLALKVNRALIRRLARKKKILPVKITFSLKNGEKKTFSTQIRVR